MSPEGRSFLQIFTKRISIKLNRLNMQEYNTMSNLVPAVAYDMLHSLKSLECWFWKQSQGIIHLGILPTWNDPVHIQPMCVASLELQHHSPAGDGVYAHVQHPPNWTMPVQQIIKLLYFWVKPEWKMFMNVVLHVVWSHKIPQIPFCELIPFCKSLLLKIIT